MPLLLPWHVRSALLSFPYGVTPLCSQTNELSTAGAVPPLIDCFDAEILEAQEAAEAALLHLCRDDACRTAVIKQLVGKLAGRITPSTELRATEVLAFHSNAHIYVTSPRVKPSLLSLRAFRRRCLAHLRRVHLRAVPPS